MKILPENSGALTRRVSFASLALCLLAIGPVSRWCGLPVLPIWPSLVALILALAWRQALPALLCGAVAGAFLLDAHDPGHVPIRIFRDQLAGSLDNFWNLSVIAFTLLMGGFVGLIRHGGGLEPVTRWLMGRGGPPKQTVQWSSYWLGYICFFDGLANSLLVGRVMTPLAAKYGPSRAKLSYIVDTTSSPVACLAFASTWIAYQLSMIQKGASLAGIPVSPYELYLRSWPANFYCLFSLFLLALVIRRGWDIGPMRKAENAPRPPAEALSENSISTASAWRAGFPLLFLLVSLIGGLFLDGGRKAPPAAAFWEWPGHADAAAVLLAASLLSCAVAFVSNRPEDGWKPAARAFFHGGADLAQPVLILVAAWMLGNTLHQLDAAGWLADSLSSRMDPRFLPLAVFLVGAVISFTTGTSWGTMGILMPLALPVALHMAAPENVIIPGVVAAVFSGSVFGDHCSPLSDTTIVSAISCGIEPFEHTRTQMPYALIAGAVAALAGFLPLGFGWPAPVALASGAVILALLARPRGTQ